MSMQDVHDILTDPTRSRPVRLLRLQGLRGSALQQAVRAGWALRLGPAACALGSAVALVLGRVEVIAAMAMLAAVGVVAPNHPIELLYNRLAPRLGRVPMPANRAGRRAGCAIGATLLTASTAAFLLGAHALGIALAATMVILPGFVAITNLCVPSLLLTVLLGAEAVTCPTLTAARRHGSGSVGAGLDACGGQSTIASRQRAASAG